MRVKEYERLTAQAALTGSLQTAAEALRANPLVGDRVNALQLAREYRDAHPALEYLR
jgi:alpha-galactosidase/6-phospho-beta-glucosidase family protein